jgi:hypothetical protein
VNTRSNETHHAHIDDDGHRHDDPRVRNLRAGDLDHAAVACAASGSDGYARTGS